jgi:Alanine dehydrogenase
MQQNPFGTEQIGIQALEKSLIHTKSKRQLQIGVPKETAADEHRIALTPSGVAMLTANGHTVTVERDAGLRAQFSDDLYLEAGASVADSPEEVFRESDLIVKVAPPTHEEWGWMAPEQTLLSALHLGNAERALIEGLMEKRIAAIGFEFIRGADGEFPIVRMMHEITGSMSVQIASHYLETDRDGQGLMLGGRGGGSRGVGGDFGGGDYGGVCGAGGDGAWGAGNGD